MAARTILKIFTGLFAIIGATSAGDCPDIPKDCGVYEFNVDCWGPLMDLRYYAHIYSASSYLSNGMGNHDFCVTPVPNVPRVEFNMCEMELYDGGLIVADTRGYCLPAACNTESFDTLVQNMLLAQVEPVEGCTTNQIADHLKHFMSCLPYDAIKRSKFNHTIPQKVFENGLEDWYNATTAYLGFGASLGQVTRFHCGDSKQGPVSEDTGAIIMTLVMIFFGLLVVLAAYEGSIRTHLFSQKSVKGVSVSSDEGEALLDKDAGASIKLNKWIQCFNPGANASNLFTPAPKRSLGGLDGARSFSMFWIILTHTALLSMINGEDGGAAQESRYFKKLDFQFIIGADKGVDTFFLISGMLMSYTMLGRLRKGKQTFMKRVHQTLLFTFLRFVRLIPLYITILFLYAFIVPHVADGPLWYGLIEETDTCRKYWFSNILFINNFYPVSFHNTCMSWSWYLANDMQFFIVGLMILFIYIKFPKVAYGIITVGSIGSTFAGYAVLVEYPSHSQDYYYDKPYMRISPFIIGIALGCLLRDTKIKETRLSTITAFVSMSLAVAGVVAMIYIDYFQFHPEIHKWDKQDVAAYSTFGRLFFILSLVVLLMLCVTENGGIVLKFLNFQFWEPLGKLTFGAYLVHPVLLRIKYYSAYYLYQFTDMDLSFTFCAVLTLAYMLSMILHITVELPFANMIKNVISK